MDLLLEYEKNKKKHRIDEISVAGGTGTFTGRAGDYIDQKFGGPFHPEFGELKDTLEKQVDGDIAKRLYTDDVTPQQILDFLEMETDLEYDEVEKTDNSKFKNTSDIEMQLVDMNIQYDEEPDKTEENKKYINPTNNWKYIHTDKGIEKR